MDDTPESRLAAAVAEAYEQPRPRSRASTVHHLVETVPCAYSSVHARLRQERGSARDRPCVDCGEVAAEWSYDWADPEQQWSRLRNTAYSLDLDHYQPRCRRCHRAFDAR